MKKSASAAASAEPPYVPTVEDVWERLWRAMPAAQEQQRSLTAEASVQDGDSAVRPSTGASDTTSRPDVQRSATSPSLSAVLLPLADMEQLASCVFLALHANAVAADVEVAVAAVLRSPALSDVSADVVDTVAPPPESFTKGDFFAFMESVPNRWAPDYASDPEDTESPPGLVEFFTELVECVVSDEPPCALLAPSAVFTLQRTTVANHLVAPVTDYVSISPPHMYPVVYDTLAAKLQLDDDRSAASLTLAQFRIFFGWFHGLHFTNTNVLRSDSAAEEVYNRYLDPRGQLTIPQFQLACEEMCATFAQRRDAAEYLQQLVQRTESVKAHSSSGDARVKAEFFLHPEEVTLPSWRRELTSPLSLYLPDELRVMQQEVERFHRHRSPRILLLGPVGVGKREVGRRLAAELNCVHLDVVELALAAVRGRRKDALAEELRASVAQRAPVSMATQVLLLQEAMTGPRAQYRGFVLSDTMACTSATADAYSDQFARPLRLLELARPDHVVEVSTTAADVYAERAHQRITAAVAASEQAWAVFEKDAAVKARAAEKAQMRADCEKILAHLLLLEGATGKAAPPAAELELAREQAAEAQGILEALDEEGEEDADGEDGSGAVDDDVNAAGDATPRTKRRGASARAEEELRLRLAAVLHEGRAAAGLLATTTATSAPLPTLPEQDWASSWRKHVDFARGTGRHVLVDPIASASTAEVTAYLARVFGLYPCDEATVLAAKGAEEVAEDDEDAEASELASDSVAADEERSRAVEEAAQEAGLALSPVWKRYCPVTALEDGVMLEGAACYACTYRGCYYCFASPSKRTAFTDYPVKYLRHNCTTERKPLLVLADDALVNALPTVTDLVQRTAADLATQLNLTPYSVSAFSKLLEPRRDLLQERHAARTTRQRAEEEARKARVERQELAVKAQGKKGKGKVEPTKPKTKRPAGGKGRESLLQQMVQQQQQQQGGGAAGLGRRRPPRATVMATPRNLAEEKAAQIHAAKEAAASGLPPLLLSAVTPGDLKADLLRALWESSLLPETVLVLRPARAAGSADTAADDEEDAEQDEAATTATGEGVDGETDAESAAGSAKSASSAPHVLAQVVDLLQKGPKVAWRSAMASPGSPVAQQAERFNIISVSVPEAALLHEVIAEVLQHLNPLAVQATEAAVDEALGEEDENAADEEAEEEEEAALLNPDGEPAPQVPRAPRHPLTRPMRRFLHQFGSRLDYCPVTLHERGILVRGRQEFCLRFLDGLYVFATQEARDAFARCPQRYVGELPPETLPPRVWLVGATHSGKKTLAAGLQEAYRVPHFVYDRQFFEECVEAALTPGGGMVRGVYIPPDAEATNPYLRRAHTLLEEVRGKAKEEKAKLKAKAEAERLLQEREQREEERAARSNPDSDEEDDDAAEGWDEAKEAELQGKLEYEPEDPEDKQVRLSEAYLRIASCVTRLRPFDTLGYVMICPPFSDGDLDVLFDEGGIPEVVMRLNIDEEVFARRAAARALERREVGQSARPQGAAAKEATARRNATQASREAARAVRRRERALRKWRRRHIGINDVDSPSDAEVEADGEAGAAVQDKSRPGEGDDEGDDEAAGDGSQPVGEEDRRAQDEALDEFMSGVEERLVEVVQINGAAAKDTVRRAVVEALGRHMRYRASLFYVPEVMRFDDAKARLAAGGCDLSSFGYEDPVRVFGYRQEGRRTACAWKPAGVRVGPEESSSGTRAYYSGASGGSSGDDSEGGNENELEEPEELSEVVSDDVRELRDVVERRKRRRLRDAALRAARVHHRLYFFENDESLLRFVRDPWPFMRQPPPNPPMLQRPVVAVYDDDARHATEEGGHKERVLADSIAFNLQVKCIAVPALLAWGAVHPNWQALRLDCMLAAQQASVDAVLVDKLLALYLSTAAVKNSGAVLHNLPNTAAAAESLTRVAAAAPIVKVVTTAPATAGDASPNEAESPSNWHGAVAALERYAAVRLDLPRPSVPLDASNLVTVVHGVEEFVLHTEEATLRGRRAFPASLRGSYQIYARLHRHLSEYGAYCPYEWLEHDDLVRSVRAPAATLAPPPPPLPPQPTDNEVELCWGAQYLGHFFFFSAAAYLERFLRDPTAVAKVSTAKPMPRHFPAVMTSPVAESSMALEGCCPVLLYDTREHRGMRRVVQPVAKKGSLDYVVEYDGQLYALLNAEHLARFMRRPWQYVAGAQLPQVLRRPLPTGMAPCDIVDHEEYIQRQLYDPVALALLAVARERPIYPGLSVEESALKFIALFLKAHRDPSTVSTFENATYRDHFQVYQQRATMYRNLPPRPESKGKQKSPAGGAAAASGRSVAAPNRGYCATLHDAVASSTNLGHLNRLPHPADAA